MSEKSFVSHDVSKTPDGADHLQSELTRNSDLLILEQNKRLVSEHGNMALPELILRQPTAYPEPSLQPTAHPELSLNKPAASSDASTKELRALSSVLSTLQVHLSRAFTEDQSELGSYVDRPHDYLREQCTFSENTARFLQRYSLRLAPHLSGDGSQTFYVPLHGITSRMLPGDYGSSAKYFRTMMEVTVPKSADNLDECTFKRSARVEESKEQYLKALAEELKGAADLPAHQGPLCFFAHGAFTGAGTSDNDAVRLAMLSGVPTVNVDWRATPGPWNTLPFRYPIDYNGAVSQENEFEPALDASFDYIGAQHGAMVSFSRGTGFDATYMKHRFEDRATDAPVCANILAHADLQTKEFKLREQNLNPIVAGSSNTIVLGNEHDGALRIGRLRILGARAGDASPSDIAAVTAAGGTYVIDQYQHRGGNFNHYIDYKVIAKMIRTLVLHQTPVDQTGNIQAKWQQQ